VLVLDGSRSEPRGPGLNAPVADETLMGFSPAARSLIDKGLTRQHPSSQNDAIWEIIVP
jgi:hypothetical protein